MFDDLRNNKGSDSDENFDSNEDLDSDADLEALKSWFYDEFVEWCNG